MQLQEKNTKMKRIELGTCLTRQCALSKTGRPLFALWCYPSLAPTLSLPACCLSERRKTDGKYALLPAPNGELTAVASKNFAKREKLRPLAAS